MLRTVEAARDGLLVCPLLHDELDVWVLAGDLGEVVAEPGASVCGRGPFIAVLEDDFADLRDEGTMSVCWSREELCPEERLGGEDVK